MKSNRLFIVDDEPGICRVLSTLFTRAGWEVMTFNNPAEALKAQQMFSSREWKRLYSDGTVTKWLQQVSDFFMTEAGEQKSTPATEYFDPSLYLATLN